MSYLPAAFVVGAAEDVALSPRRGGEADKFGGRYEGRWTVSALLRVLVGHAASIVIEERGEGGKGVEFVLTRHDGVVEGHQVKRQRGNQNNWTVRNLRDEDVLKAAAEQVNLGREFWFVSIIPCRDLHELSDRARRSDDLQAFVDHLGHKLNEKFSFLVEEWGSAEEACSILQEIHVRWPDERHLVDTNAGLSELLLAGAHGRASAVALGDLAWENLGKTLDAEAVEAALGDYGLSRAQLASLQTTTAVGDTLSFWSQSVARELLSPEIPRAEADEIVDRLRSGRSKVLLVSGAAGHGKSAVLHQAVSTLAADWPVLAMRLDLIEVFSSTHELGVDRLGLPASPVAALAAVAEGGDCLLVIDQLDAVSLASGRMPANFEHVAASIREAEAFGGMRVLLACRQFDIDNDYRLRGLVAEDGPAEQMTIGALSDEQVAGAVDAMGLDPAALTATQKELLRSPLHLVLLRAIADEPDALSFSTAKGLMDAFYDRKRRASDVHGGDRVRFGETVNTLVENMSNNQRLYAPVAVLDAADLQRDADVMASEHVLVRSDARLRFFHEAFFDYAFARSWLARDQTLVAFLQSGEQELFRRAQVRQVLIHLRSDEPDRFVAEVDELLSVPSIRFHIKEVLVALMRAIEDPTAAEWQLIERQIAAAPDSVERLWAMLRTRSWFDRLDAEGVIEQWLSRDDEHFARAIDVMTSVSTERPGRLAALLAPLRDEPLYAGALRRVSFNVDLHTSREMFELVLEAIRDGHFDESAHDLFMSAHGLGTDQPRWGCELLAAWFAQRPDPFELDADGKIAALQGHDHGAEEVIAGAAAGAPADFAAFAVPYVLQVMAATASDNRRPRRDRHFGFRTYNARHYELDEALFYGARDALRAMVSAGAHREVRPLLEALAADEHDGAQWVLYEALAADGATYRDWAVELLTEDERRLYSGYICSSFWTARVLVLAIAPHLTDEQVGALEKVFVDLLPEWEGRPPGRASFTFLSAVPEERLSEKGRRRLQELRRLFGEAPAPPTGIQIGTVSAPIPQQAAQKMNDEQWLGAIAKHSSDRTDWSGFTGGAHEQAMVLQEETKADPDRFARLALQFDDTTHPAYASAVVRGLSDADDVEPQRIFEVMRHVAGLGQAENDQALTQALRRRLNADVPDDIIELLLDRALHSPDPDHEAWQESAWSGEKYYNGDPFSCGMNTVRGAAALTLGDLLVHDADGQRTALVARSLETLASDPSTAVRCCVAHLLAAGLRHAREAMVEAFGKLIDAPDELLGTHPVEELIVYLGFGDSGLVEPVISRMLGSEVEPTREAGGRLAAFAALELELGHLLDDAVESSDAAIRRGAAKICAHRLPITSYVARAEAALRTFFSDDDEKVRDYAAEVAGALRNRALAPHRKLIEVLVASPAFEDALTQFLITLEQATEPVDELVIVTARRFIDLHRGQISNFSTRAAGDSKEVGELVLRAYAQAPDASARAQALDLVDDLLAEAAYNFSKIIEQAER